MGMMELIGSGGGVGGGVAREKFLLMLSHRLNGGKSKAEAKRI